MAFTSCVPEVCKEDRDQLQVLEKRRDVVYNPLGSLGSLLDILGNLGNVYRYLES